jgi:hypothetical protein
MKRDDRESLWIAAMLIIATIIFILRIRGDIS